MKSLSTKNIILVSVVLAVLIFGGAFFASKNKSKEVITESTSTPVAEMEVQEEIKDGVYTNYTYGFIFEYDSNLFTNIEYSNNERVSIVTEDANSTPVLYIDFPQGELESQFDDDYTKCINNSFESGNNVKIYSNSIGCASSFNPIGLIDIEPTWGYAGYFSTPEGVVRISLILSSEYEMSKFKDIFNKMFTSFTLAN